MDDACLNAETVDNSTGSVSLNIVYVDTEVVTLYSKNIDRNLKYESFAPSGNDNSTVSSLCGEKKTLESILLALLCTNAIILIVLLNHWFQIRIVQRDRS